MLQGGPGDPGLDLAALQIATIEYPELAPGSFLELLDSYARELGERVRPDADGEEFIHTTNEYLFEELGFQGNQQEYYHPANSCLNEVLTKRVGIPITCPSFTWRSRAAWVVPFTVSDSPDTSSSSTKIRRSHAFIDPFHAGRLMFESECFDLAREITGLDISADPASSSPSASARFWSGC